ncbi:cysteine hydrolase [Desulfovibrio sp. OttesenSCG-928-I05]|nr:cysteine hydrolase [Desulfovibrio sp. OttesenSCG-928-I05]
MKSLLVIVDMQRDFVSGALGTPEAREILPRVAKRIRRAKADGVSLAYTMDTHQSDYLQTQEGRNLPVAHCIEGTEGWAVCPELSGLLEGAPAFHKPSFGSPALAEYVKNEGFDRIELAGVCTGICVLSNAALIKAYVPEAEIVVDKTLCACVSPETHQTAIRAMELLQIRTQRSDQP